MTWDTARSTLDARFKTLTGFKEENTNWPNRKFTQPKNLHYKIDFIPAAVDPEMGGTAHEKGIYQVSIWAPIDGGIGPAMQAADAVIALFDRKKLTNVQCGVPVPGPYISDPAWLHLPISIPFQVL